MSFSCSTTPSLALHLAGENVCIKLRSDRVIRAGSIVIESWSSVPAGAPPDLNTTWIGSFVVSELELLDDVVSKLTLTNGSQSISLASRPPSISVDLQFSLDPFPLLFPGEIFISVAHARPARVTAREDQPMLLSEHPLLINSSTGVFTRKTALPGNLALNRDRPNVCLFTSASGHPILFVFSRAFGLIFIYNMTAQLATDGHILPRLLASMGSDGNVVVGVDIAYDVPVLFQFVETVGMASFVDVPLISFEGGAGDGEFSVESRHVAFAPDGLLYILDFGNGRVQSVDPDDGYSFVAKFTIAAGVTNTQFAINEAGVMFLGDGNGGGFAYLAASGEFIGTFGLPAPVDGDHLPVGSAPHIFVDLSNHVFVVDRTGIYQYAVNRICRFGVMFIDGERKRQSSVLDGLGGVTVLSSTQAIGDPHLIGANHAKFDFFGVADAFYVLFSAPQFRVTARLAADGPSNHFMIEIGVQFRNLTLTFSTIAHGPKFVTGLDRQLHLLGGRARALSSTSIQLELCSTHTVTIHQRRTNRPELAHADGGAFFFVNVDIVTPGCHDSFDGALGQTYKCKYLTGKERFVFSRAQEEQFRIPSLFATKLNLAQSCD